MAKIISNPKPNVTLELTGAEAEALYTLLQKEEWPTTAKFADLLNDVYEALGDADSVDTVADEEWTD